jgi:hypothetical protein
LLTKLGQRGYSVRELSDTYVREQGKGDFDSDTDSDPDGDISGPESENTR